jgi:hypothetical protein
MAMQNQIENYVHLPGQNCVTTAIRNVLNFYGFRFQEPMVLGLAEGLGFQFKRINGSPYPYLSGTGKGLIEAFCRNVHITIDDREFDNDQEALEDVKSHIDRQTPLIVQLDLFYLPYFESEIHFAGHRIVPVGYDDDFIYCSDTGFLTIQKCPIDKFIEARRSVYPPFVTQRRRTRIEKVTERPFVEEMVTKALYNLSHKIDNHLPGYNLLEILDLRDSLDLYKNYPDQLFIQIEKAGTGGGLARKMFADFLDLASQMYLRPIYELASAIFAESAEHWREIAVIAKKGSLEGIAPKLPRIYELESRAIKVFSSFESEDL